MNNFWYDAIKRYYGLGCYTNENMRVFVKAERITKEQYKAIVGEDYDKPVTSTEEITKQV